MKIIKRDKMPNGTRIQIEDWSEDLTFKNKNATIGTYPLSKVSLDGQFAPKRNRSFRFQLDFENEEKALNIFNKLVTGEIELSDCKKYHSDKKEYLECV